MSQLLRIGEFAALTRVSVKALRFYAAEALLAPAWIDPDSGYRYYRVEQARDLALIANLRAAGFSIAEVRKVVDAPGDTASLLDVIDDKRAALDEARAGIDRQQAVLETLTRSVLGDRDDPLSGVRLTAAPAQSVHSRKATVPHLGEPVTALFESAEATVARAKARAPESPFLLFHDDEIRETALRLEVCIPVIEQRAAAVPTQRIGACPRGVSVVYSGDYSQTRPLRESMLEWIGEARLSAVGPLREIYHRFGARQQGYTLPKTVLTSRSDEFVTELFIPVS